MTYRVVLQANIETSSDEIAGAKDAIAEALELMGCDVSYIKFMPVDGDEQL